MVWPPPVPQRLCSIRSETLERCPLQPTCFFPLIYEHARLCVAILTLVLDLNIGKLSSLHSVYLDVHMMLASNSTLPSLYLPVNAFFLNEFN